MSKLAAQKSTIINDAPASDILNASISPACFAPSLTGLLLTDFRSYTATQLNCGTGSVVLTGDNGAGKTNIVEAISLLGPGRGMRSAQLRDLARHDGAGGWALAANVQTAEGDMQFGVGLDANLDSASNAESRRLRIDGAPAKGFEKLGRWLPQLWLTPAMDRLFVEGASARRKFFDRFALGLVSVHNKNLSAYEKAMRERNRLLQDGQQGQWHEQSSWLDSLEASMALAGVAIAEARLAALDALASSLLDGHHTGFPQAEIALDGLLEADLRQRPALEVEDDFRAQLARTRPLDAAAGRTLAGPHRSDFITRHIGKDMPADKCSTGEQKSLLVGLVLAQARVLTKQTGTVPLLLLDEVGAHLDAISRAALFDVVAGLGSQAWITGTDSRMFADFSKNVTHIQVVENQLHQIDLL